MQLEVIVPKLRKRKSPVTDFADRSNVIGTVKQGFRFESDGEIFNILGRWVKDRDGSFYWGNGVSKNLQTSNLKFSIQNGNWWLNSLNLTSIWEEFNEKGEQAKIAILDSGYNVNISDIADGVKESKVFFSSVAGLPVMINDTFGHGSHCASLIGSRNKNLVCGCAPDSSLYIAKICSQGSVRSFSIMVDAIKWAIERKVDIISISYGGESNDVDLDAIIHSAVHEHNILVIASIGDVIPNSTNTPCFPALLNNCIAVGANNEENKIDSITIISSKTELNAPGKDIAGYSVTDEPQIMTGTSQATAIVAGICALMISRHKKMGKNYTVKSIRDLLIQNFDFSTDGKNQKIISPSKIFAKI